MHSQNKINAQLQPLTQVYTNLLFEFKTTNKSYIIPNTFKAVLENLNPLFQGNQASDAKDFIFFIIERLHQELKPPDNPPNNLVQINFLQQELEA
jgi:ubiquitin C-terminal hydrolase